MKTTLLALAMVLASVIGVTAIAQPVGTPETVPVELYTVYTCTTHSQGATYRVTDGDPQRAERGAVRACVRNGGVQQECRYNLYCVAHEGPDYPPPPPPPPPPGPYPPYPPPHGSYFDWGLANDGYGYCYEWTWDGRILNGGRPIPNHQCEAVAPSHFAWGRATNGYTYCYQRTPQGWIMNSGRPVPNAYCR